jgi:RNA polymerase sigma factor (sigma-70 family)
MEKAELIDIIQKSKDGDMEAMEKLLLHAHTSVSYQCRKMLKNEQDAEDMTQEILVTVYQKLDSLKEPAAFNPWLKKITATRCINVLTRTHVELQFAEDEEGNSILNTIEEMDEKKIPDKWLDNKETTRMIEEIVNGLPDVQRLCTLMFYYSEMSVKEIAYVLKVSENTIKSRLNYARKAIKERVLDYEKKGVKLYGLSPLPFLFYFLHKRENDEKGFVGCAISLEKGVASITFNDDSGKIFGSESVKL